MKTKRTILFLTLAGMFSALPAQITNIGKDKEQFNGKIRNERLLFFLEFLLVSCAVISLGKNCPMLPKHLYGKVENVDGTFLTQIIGREEHHAKVPFRGTVGKIAYVNP